MYNGVPQGLDDEKRRAHEELKMYAAQHVEAERQEAAQMQSSRQAPVESAPKKGGLGIIIAIVLVLGFLGIIGAAAFIFVIGGLNSSSSVNLNTGQTTTGIGLDYDDAYLMVDGKKNATGDVNIGSKVQLFLEGISGFEEIDGNIFPAMAIDVVDSSGVSIMSAENALSKYETTGMDSANNELFANITVGDPMLSGESYIIKIKVTDLAGPKDSEINSSFEITVAADSGALDDENPSEETNPVSNSSFDVASAIVDEDLVSLGIEEVVSMESEMAVDDYALGTADTYTYEVSDCDFVLRYYSDPAYAKEGFDSFRVSYSAGLFAFANWEVGFEGELGADSFEGEKGESIRPIFSKSNYLFETTGMCDGLTSEQIRKIAALVYEKI